MTFIPKKPEDLGELGILSSFPLYFPDTPAYRWYEKLTDARQHHLPTNTDYFYVLVYLFDSEHNSTSRIDLLKSPLADAVFIHLPDQFLTLRVVSN